MTLLGRATIFEVVCNFLYSDQAKDLSDIEVTRSVYYKDKIGIYLDALFETTLFA